MFSACLYVHAGRLLYCGLRATSSFGCIFAVRSDYLCGGVDCGGLRVSPYYIRKITFWNGAPKILACARPIVLWQYAAAVLKAIKNAYNKRSMRMFSEILKQLSAEGDLETSRVQYSVVDGKGGYFQNVKRILEFSQTKIVLQGKKSKVTVEGEGLSVGKYFGGDATVLGNIIRVERETC